MNKFKSAYQARDTVLRRLEEDLLGGSFDDRLTEAPLSRFVVGVLYPDTSDTAAEPPSGALDEPLEAAARASVNRSVENDVEGDVEDVNDVEAPDSVDDPAVSLSKVKHPRSVGITFGVTDKPQASFSVSVNAAAYDQIGEGDWKRRKLSASPLTLDASVPGTTKHMLADGLELSAVVRRPWAGVAAVTLSLVNRAVALRGHRDALCWFMPQIVVNPVDAEICERASLVVAGIEAEEVASQRLLFRDTKSYAVGHGCAAEWDLSEGHITELRTTFLPKHELLLADAGGSNEVNLTMDHLAKTDDYSGLGRLVQDYQTWIDELDADASDLTDDEREVLHAHVRDATAAAARMREGISLLESDDDVRRAFRLTNLAMAQQRSRQDHHRSGRLGDPPSTRKASWRPFQIAFILTNLCGLADGEHPDRRIADVLWFPTGGGKTEAYLGIIGIAILLRRIRHPEVGGVSVLMRYTLRLLTLQQYQRAAGLVCALEYLREEHLPHSAVISIGLWVGQGSTPNNVAAARRALQDLRRGRTVSDTDADSGDPVQLRQCPWCGTALDHNNYEIVDRAWMKVACGVSTCAFRNGLPVHIIDDDVYAARPSLVIATVDKFAMLPWKSETGSLLGTEASRQVGGPGPLPPDLIVQDELHLISGPLGTIVGLYETAIDAIASRIHPPKIVASTATIRRAAEQVRTVFAREARQFPPPGLTHRDSYFAVETPREQKASRAYAGVMAPGTSHTTLMVRVYASLLQSAAAIPESSPDADLYWTLLGYFNSLRVLGGAYIQVIDDVPDQVKVVAGRRGEQPRPRSEPREMTSRKKSWEIPVELEILGQRRGEPEAADVVLATNMISVGVDVERLGLMVVMGQPQTNSEYIQATSRVGRQLPGLVVTLYNAARSRDLSHYEDFSAYHRMLYRHVEATGATPFAPRARDRALHAVLVALARHTIPAASPGRAAGDIELWASELARCLDTILQRLADVRDKGGAEPEDESTDFVRDQVEQLVDEWTVGDVDHYEGWFDRSRGALLIEASRAVTQGDDTITPEFPPREPPWPTLTSMRDVDAESSVYLIDPRRSSSR